LEALVFFLIARLLAAEMFYEEVNRAVATLFLFVGVASSVSAEELLSLSVDSMLSDVATPSLPLPVPLVPSAVRARTSWLDLILATILFAFHYVHMKLYSSHSSKSPIDHQNLCFRQFLINIELFPLPI
jgi:hypothetical protein